MISNEQELQQVILQDIPITQSIGVGVKKITPEAVTLIAPIEHNLNHQNTAFGGSVGSILILAAWGLLYCHLKPLGTLGHIVTQECNIKFLQPVSGEIEACCQIDSIEKIDKFINMFRRQGLARIELKAHIKNSTGKAVEFSGTFVAQSEKAEDLFGQMVLSNA